MRNIQGLRAFQDNYIWVIQEDDHAVVIDPGDATPVIAYLAKAHCKLTHILLTHHHFDHVNGVETLLRYGHEQHPEQPVTVIAPQEVVLACPMQRVMGGEGLVIHSWRVQVLNLSGHTLGHVGYVFQAQATHEPLQCFVGDALFSAGCGRLFEGDASHLARSLACLTALPDNSQIFPTHEYTLANLIFAEQVEPHNAERMAYHRRVQSLRTHDQPTLPTSLQLEKQINPYLRVHEHEVRQSILKYWSCRDDESLVAHFTSILPFLQTLPPTEAVACAYLAGLRLWKDQFKA